MVNWPILQRTSLRPFLGNTVPDQTAYAACLVTFYHLAVIHLYKFFGHWLWASAYELVVYKQLLSGKNAGGDERGLIRGEEHRQEQDYCTERGKRRSTEWYDLR